MQTTWDDWTWHDYNEEKVMRFYLRRNKDGMDIGKYHCEGID